MDGAKLSITSAATGYKGKAYTRAEWEARMQRYFYLKILGKHWVDPLYLIPKDKYGETFDYIVDPKLRDNMFSAVKERMIQDSTFQSIIFQEAQRMGNLIRDIITLGKVRLFHWRR